MEPIGGISRKLHEARAEASQDGWSRGLRSVVQISSLRRNDVLFAIQLRPPQEMKFEGQTYDYESGGLETALGRTLLGSWWVPNAHGRPNRLRRWQDLGVAFGARDPPWNPGRFVPNSHEFGDGVAVNAPQ
jgi:hypothetical protein